jgi:hypothetical protein
VGPDVHAREILEGGFVGADHEEVEGFGGGRDDEVVRAARFALRSDLDQESCVRFGNVEVVVEDGDGADDVLDISGSCRLKPTVGQKGAHSKFGHGDRCDGHVVVIIDDDVEIASGSFGVDEETSCRAGGGSPALVDLEEPSDLVEIGSPAPVWTVASVPRRRE